MLPVREQQIRILQGQTQADAAAAAGGRGGTSVPRLTIKELVTPSDSDASSSLDLALSPAGDAVTPSVSVDCGRPLLEAAPSDAAGSSGRCSNDANLSSNCGKLFLVSRGRDGEGDSRHAGWPGAVQSKGPHGRT